MWWKWGRRGTDSNWYEFLHKKYEFSLGPKKFVLSILAQDPMDYYWVKRRPYNILGPTIIQGFTKSTNSHWGQQNLYFSYYWPRDLRIVIRPRGSPYKISRPRSYGLFMTISFYDYCLREEFARDKRRSLVLYAATMSQGQCSVRRKGPTPQCPDELRCQLSLLHRDLPDARYHYRRYVVRPTSNEPAKKNKT